MFLKNSFSKKYFDIIKNNEIVDIESVYCERHHIIPKSLGGSNKKENTVYITAKDHFRCHKLLVNFTKGADKGKMWSALWRMMNKQSYNQLRNYNFTEKDYEISRIKHALAHSKRMSGEKNPFFGKQHTDETKQKMSKRKKGKSYDEIHGKELADKMRERRKIEATGKKLSDVTKEKIRQKKLGRSRDPLLMKAIGEKLRGRKQSKETLEKKRISREANKKKCGHCGKILVSFNYTRWHGVNCKFKNRITNYANDVDIIV